jgi:hypothetical protein
MPRCSFRLGAAETTARQNFGDERGGCLGNHPRTRPTYHFVDGAYHSLGMLGAGGLINADHRQ